MKTIEIVIKLQITPSGKLTISEDSGVSRDVVRSLLKGASKPTKRKYTKRTQPVTKKGKVTKYYDDRKIVNTKGQKRGKHPKHSTYMFPLEDQRSIAESLISGVEFSIANTRVRGHHSITGDRLWCIFPDRDGDYCLPKEFDKPSALPTLAFFKHEGTKWTYELYSTAFVKDAWKHFKRPFTATKPPAKLLWKILNDYQHYMATPTAGSPAAASQ